jgi:3-oxoacyl-[acyl-carrier-protein] synthase II
VPTRASIAVVGVGVKAPGGTTVASLWSSLCAGDSSAKRYVDPRLPEGAVALVSDVDGFDAASYVSAAELRRLDRSHLLAIGAAQDAIDSMAGALPEPERCAVVVGTGFGATATYETQHTRLLEGGLRALTPLVIPLVMPNATASLLSMRFGCKGPCLTVSTACASGANAIGEGVELLRRFAADVVIAGGVDSMINFNALCSFMRLDVMSRNIACPAQASRPFDVERDGFVMGEGAGFVVLRRGEDASAAGDHVYGHVMGYGSNADAHHLVAPSADGEGAQRCMRLALDDAGASSSDVSHVNSHGTGTILNDLAESTAIEAVFGAVSPPVTATKSTTGHMIAGSGAVEAIVTLWSLRHQMVPPVAGLQKIDPKIPLDVVNGAPRAIGPGLGLSNSFGFGGANACLVLAAP